jgi:NAD-dependent DNA ligase
MEGVMPDTPRDEDGQPPRRFYSERVGDRLVAELLGVCKGLVCDGAISEGETLGFKRWLQGHPIATMGYPGDVLARRLVAMYEDGVADDEERRELYEQMMQLTGETEDHRENLHKTTRHFYDDPPPTVVFDSTEFVFTGRMLYGTRKQCERAVADRGGRCHPQPRYDTDYLVVGPDASEAWIQSTHGLKLLHAADLRTKGAKIKIVTEEHWIQQLHA